MKPNYPLHAASPVHAPTPTTLWITNGIQGMAKAPNARVHAFEMTAEEARAAPDVVTGM